MTGDRRHLVVPLFLFASLMLGGASGGGVVANLLLQLASLPILVWAAATDAPARADAGRVPLLLAGAIVAMMLLQLVPMPPALWTLLPGTGAVADGYRLLGIPLPWRPVSLMPEATVAAFLWLLPAFAVLLGMLRLGAFRSRLVAWTVVAATLVNVLLGTLQVIGGADSPLYFYSITNIGNAVGLFANSNHSATLLVAAIPFVAALRAAARARARDAKQVSAMAVIVVAAIVVIGVGLLINTSLAGIGLGIPAIIGSAFIGRATTGRRVRQGVFLTIGLAVAAAAVIVVGPFSSNLIDRGDAQGELRELTRASTIGRTVEAVPTYLPFGSGGGSFRAVYRTVENVDEVYRTYINHAHSDVAEVALEYGLMGIAVMLLLAGWWLRRTIALWAAERPDPFARAGSIVVGVIMAHSLVDYPLRTAGIAALFAAALALMAGARAYVRPTRSEHRARHLGV